MSAPEKDRRVRVVRNTRKSFLLGASWSHDPAWDCPRLTHIYLGPWLMTVTTNRRVIRPGSVKP